MAVKGNSCFLVVDFVIIFSSETAFPNEQAILVSDWSISKKCSRIACDGHVC
jgi:hypothetical protein